MKLNLLFQLRQKNFVRTDLEKPQVSSPVPSPFSLQPTKERVPSEIEVLESPTQSTKQTARPLPKARLQVVAPQLLPVEKPVPPKQPHTEVKRKSLQPTKELQPTAQSLKRPNKKQGLLFTSSSESEEYEMSKPVMKFLTPIFLTG
uniref:Uncharacterized protein n=1 Tax=Ditylenchus dipsaci TaxID=166011 RepID=A0A915ESE6_9BILA